MPNPKTGDRLVGRSAPEVSPTFQSFLPLPYEYIKESGLILFNKLINSLKKTVVESVVCFFLRGVIERLTKTDLHGM